MISKVLPIHPARQPFWHLTTLRFGCFLAGMNVNMNLVTDAKFAFVVAEKQKYTPATGADYEKNWLNFVGNIRQNTRQPEGTQTIHDNIWLIELSNGLPFLAELIRWADSYSVPIRILFLEEAPTWIKYPPDAKPSA